jgi:hypothetical protein
VHFIGLGVVSWLSAVHGMNNIKALQSLLNPHGLDGLNRGVSTLFLFFKC